MFGIERSAASEVQVHERYSLMTYNAPFGHENSRDRKII